MFDFKGKRIIVTGATRGLGRVAAEAFASAGARLALFGRSLERLEEARAALIEPPSHVCCAADLTDASAIGQSVEAARASLGAIDVVFHAAGGGLGLKAPLLDSSELWKLFMSNFGGAAEINRLVAPEMRARRKGNLVHVGSIASVEGVGSVGYGTVKAALAGYVRNLGRALAPDGVVVTGIMPGGFAGADNAMDRLARNKPEAHREFIKQRLPRGRMGDAKELLPLVFLLCSDEASMMGGCMVPIDAGEGVAYVS